MPQTESNAQHTSGLPDRTGWFRAFQNLPREHGFEPLEVEGTIPPDLRGTLYRNGTGIFDLFGHPYGHWFDGEGAVSAVRFEGGRAFGAARLVESRGLARERREGRASYATFGTPGRGLRRFLPPKNAANTSVMIWQDRLFALYEGGKPTEISREDLRTLGESNLGGVVAFMFSAHPHRVPARRASYNFGMGFGLRPRLDLYELPDAGPARRIGTVPLPGACMAHDFIATETHLLFLIHPYRVNPLRMLAGLGTVADCVSWHPNEASHVIAVPIDRPAEAVRFETGAFIQWHFVNAFARGGEVVVDLITYGDFDLVAYTRGVVAGRADGLPGRLTRAVIDPAARRLTLEERWAGPCETPAIDPRRRGAEHRLAYLLASSSQEQARGNMPDAIARVDVGTGEAAVVRMGGEQFPSEPIFVPRGGSEALSGGTQNLTRGSVPHAPGGEDDGHLLTLVYDAREHRSHIAILDAAEVERGPVARAWFDHHLPFTFHGAWQPAG